MLYQDVRDVMIEVIASALKVAYLTLDKEEAFLALNHASTSPQALAPFGDFLLAESDRVLDLLRLLEAAPFFNGTSVLTLAVNVLASFTRVRTRSLSL